MYFVNKKHLCFPERAQKSNTKKLYQGNQQNINVNNVCLIKNAQVKREKKIWIKVLLRQFNSKPVTRLTRLSLLVFQTTINLYFVASRKSFASLMLFSTQFDDLDELVTFALIAMVREKIADASNRESLKLWLRGRCFHFLLSREHLEIII